MFSIAAPSHTTPAAGSGFDDAASPDTVVSSCGLRKTQITEIKYLVAIYVALRKQKI